MDDKNNNEIQIWPMIIRDSGSGAVISLFWCNQESLARIRESGYLWRFSRKQGKVVQKGYSSGNVMKIISIKEDCDNDAFLVDVAIEGKGIGCHTGSYSCFWDKGYDILFLDKLARVISGRRDSDPSKSYTARLLANPKEIELKLEEELQELLQSRDGKELGWEAADLLYFLMVYLESRGSGIGEAVKELRKRRKE